MSDETETDTRPSARERASEAWTRLRETLSEARRSGDVSAERARDALRSATERARSATTEARERFDFVSRAEHDALVERITRLEARLAERPGGAAE